MISFALQHAPQLQASLGGLMVRACSGRRTICPAFAVLLLVACSSDERAKPKPKTHAIAIQGFAYRPAEVTIAAGDTVVWINQDIVPHTATAKGKRLDSGSIEANQSWRYVATKNGTYAYGCSFHPNMKGILIVK